MQAPTKQEDYNEIFRSSSGSSIPILELSDTDGSVNLRSSEINYKDVFSGCSEDTQAIGVSYQDLLSANVRYYYFLLSCLCRVAGEHVLA